MICNFQAVFHHISHQQNEALVSTNTCLGRARRLKNIAPNKLIRPKVEKQKRNELKLTLWLSEKHKINTRSVKTKKLFEALNCYILASGLEIPNLQKVLTKNEA